MKKYKKNIKKLLLKRLSNLKYYYSYTPHILVLITSALFWRHHQHLHYRSFTDLDYDLTLSADSKNFNDVVGLNEIIKYISIKTKEDVVLTNVIDDKSVYNSIGRKVMTKNSVYRVYEYEDEKTAKKTLKKVQTENISSYKNWIIVKEI